MTNIKVCGIRREEDIQIVNTYLPQYIGFIFAPSKRQVAVEDVVRLSLHLDDSIKKVGVFVNESIENIVDAAKKCLLDVVQLHGEESPDFIENVRSALKEHIPHGGKIEIWKALRVKDKDSLQKMDMFKVDCFVLDAYVEGLYGGAGKTFDWELALLAKKYGKIFLAGGLTPYNARDAVHLVNPYGLDVSSGVETEGFKDKEKVRQFIENAGMEGI